MDLCLCIKIFTTLGNPSEEARLGKDDDDCSDIDASEGRGRWESCNSRQAEGAVGRGFVDIIRLLFEFAPVKLNKNIIK